MSSAELVPTFTTAVNTWQCDENDHLNVQYYTEFGHEASAHLLNRLGFGPRAQAAEDTSVRVASDHIRYLREFRVIDSVEVRSAPIEVSDHAMVVYHEIRNPADGSVASTVRRRLVSDKPWPLAVRRAAERAQIDLPASAKPRSVGALSLPDMSLAEAERSGLIDVGRTMVKPAECDERGELLPRHQFSRYSDAAPWLWNHLGFDRVAMQARGEGSVVVEMLNHYRRPLRAGDLIVVMSGLADFSDKVLKFVHFLFDAETGTLAACAEAVGMKFDQRIRRIMTFSADDKARLATRRVSF